jgi:hypothetical protein
MVFRNEWQQGLWFRRNVGSGAIVVPLRSDETQGQCSRADAAVQDGVAFHSVYIMRVGTIVSEHKHACVAEL